MRARHAWYLRAGYLFGLPETLYFLYVCSSRTVKFADVYCIGYSPTDCANGSGSILYLGIALSPQT
jgi:hypothetical protein